MFLNQNKTYDLWWSFWLLSFMCFLLHQFCRILFSSCGLLFIPNSFSHILCRLKIIYIFLSSTMMYMYLLFSYSLSVKSFFPAILLKCDWYVMSRFESVYMDDEIRVAKDIRGDYLVVDRAPYSWKEWNIGWGNLLIYLIFFSVHSLRLCFAQTNVFYWPKW